MSRWSEARPEGGPGTTAITENLCLHATPQMAEEAASVARQDITDSFAIDPCEPDGSTSTLASDHYRFREECRARFSSVSAVSADIWTIIVATSVIQKE